MSLHLTATISSTKLTRNILIAMLLGLSLGLWLHGIPQAEYAWVDIYITQGALALGSGLFITSIKLLVVPMIAVSLIYAMSRLGDAKNIGRLGFKTIILHFLTSLLAVMLAMFFCGFI